MKAGKGGGGIRGRGSAGNTSEKETGKRIKS